MSLDAGGPPSTVPTEHDKPGLGLQATAVRGGRTLMRGRTMSIAGRIGPYTI